MRLARLPELQQTGYQASTCPDPATSFVPLPGRRPRCPARSRPTAWLPSTPTHSRAAKTPSRRRRRRRRRAYPATLNPTIPAPAPRAWRRQPAGLRLPPCGRQRAPAKAESPPTCRDVNNPATAGCLAAMAFIDMVHRPIQQAGESASGLRSTVRCLQLALGVGHVVARCPTPCPTSQHAWDTWLVGHVAQVGRGDAWDAWHAWDTSSRPRRPLLTRYLEYAVSRHVWPRGSARQRPEDTFRARALPGCRHRGRSVELRPLHYILDLSQ